MTDQLEKCEHDRGHLLLVSCQVLLKLQKKSKNMSAEAMIVIFVDGSVWKHKLGRGICRAVSEKHKKGKVNADEWQMKDIELKRKS